MLDILYTNTILHILKTRFSEETITKKHGDDTYIVFKRSGALGILKEGKNPYTGKEVTDHIGTSLCLVTGIGKNSEDRAYNSSSFRGRTSAEGAVIMALVSNKPKLPSSGRIYIK